MGKQDVNSIPADGEWKEFLRKGNLKALEVIYNIFYDRLFSYCKKLGFGTQTVEDAIQNVFVNLLKSRKQLGAIEKIFPYLVTSVRNELFRLGISDKNFSLTDVSQRIDLAEIAREDEIIRGEADMKIQSLLARIIRKLPPSQQEIIYLRFYSAMEYDEIAAILSISVESCRTSIYRSLKAVRKEVEVLKQNGVVFYL